MLTLYSVSTLQQAKAAAVKTQKKKKWSKGKVKDKATNAVILDKVLFDRIMKEVPTFKMISQSTLIDRLKIGGSLARLAIRHLEGLALIKPIVHHNGQLVYSALFSHHYISLPWPSFPLHCLHQFPNFPSRTATSSSLHPGSATDSLYHVAIARTTDEEAA